MVVFCGLLVVSFFFFFFQAEDGIRDVAVTGVQTCALPILRRRTEAFILVNNRAEGYAPGTIRALAELWEEGERSEEHTSELQSRLHLVCRLLLEKKKRNNRETCRPHRPCGGWRRHGLVTPR